MALRRGGIETTVDFVSRATAAEPRFAQAHNALGAAQKAAGKPDEAMKSCRTATLPLGSDRKAPDMLLLGFDVAAAGLSQFFEP